MQNMHKTTYDGPLTGVHLPIHRCRGSGAGVGMSTRAGSTHRGAGRGSKAVVYITATIDLTNHFRAHLKNSGFTVPESLIAKLTSEKSAHNSIVKLIYLE